MVHSTLFVAAIHLTASDASDPAVISSTCNIRRVLNRACGDAMLFMPRLRAEGADPFRSRARVELLDASLMQDVFLCFQFLYLHTLFDHLGCSVFSYILINTGYYDGEYTAYHNDYSFQTGTVATSNSLCFARQWS